MKSLEQVEALVERVEAALAEKFADATYWLDVESQRQAKRRFDLDRKRVMSDWAGLQRHNPDGHHCISGGGRVWLHGSECGDSKRYLAGLERTAEDYDVE